MEDRLNQIAERLRQVERELADPAVYSDQQRLKNLSREQKELTPVVEGEQGNAGGCGTRRAAVLCRCAGKHHAAGMKPASA